LSFFSLATALLTSSSKIGTCMFISIEVRNVVARLKNGRAAGVDCSQRDLLKYRAFLCEIV